MGPRPEEPRADERLAIWRRAFMVGDFAGALPFVAALSRREDQVERFMRAYRRSVANADGVSPARTLAVARLTATTARAMKHARAWGWSWATLTPGRSVDGEWLAGMRMWVACFADRDLGIATLGVRAGLDTQNVMHVWPKWRGASQRVRAEKTVENLRRWALDDGEEDRAMFMLADVVGDPSYTDPPTRLAGAMIYEANRGGS